MTDLGPDARSFLDSVRDADDPSPADAARVRAGLALRIGAAAAAGTAATLGAKGASAGVAGTAGLGAAAGGAGAASVATAAGGALATKLIVALVVVGGTVGVSAVALRVPPPSKPPAFSALVAVSTTPSGEAAPLAPGDAPKPADSAAPSASAPTLAIRAPVAGAAAKTASPAARAPAEASPDRLLEEAALIRAANTALSSGDAATALARLDDHASRFPRGALSEERGATRVHALCAAGRVAEARAAASTFVDAHPRSALAPAVRRSCTTE